MTAYPTDLYLASQTARELVAVDPPYAILSVVFAICGFAFLAGGYFLLYLFRVGWARPFQIALWMLPLLVGSPFLVSAVATGRATRIVLSADTGKLSVQKTFLSIPIGAGSKEYPLQQVRLVKVGVGRVCRFLYVSLNDRPAEDLTGCTDRTGYSEIADAMNAFLDANRRSSPPGAPTADVTRIGDVR